MGGGSGGSLKECESDGRAGRWLAARLLEPISVGVIHDPPEYVRVGMRACLLAHVWSYMLLVGAVGGLRQSESSLACELCLKLVALCSGQLVRCSGLLRSSILPVDLRAHPTSGSRPQVVLGCPMLLLTIASC